MTEIIDRYLNQLNNCLKSSSSNRGNEAADICSDLRAYCIENITATQIAYCSSLLFNQDGGILTFAKAVVLVDEFAKCKEIILSFLAEYITKVKTRISPYATDIKDICLKLFSNDKNSRVKNETFQVLLQLLELKFDSTIVEKLNVENIVEKYFSACCQPTKHTSTVKYGIYSLLGTLAEFFPEFMVTRADRLVQIYVGVLKAEMKKSSKPDMPVIAGCLRGLGSTLVNFTQAVDEGSQYAKDIYTYVRRAIDTSVEYSRYEVPRAGLNFLARHAAQYKEYLTRDYEVVYETLVSWCKRSNKETRGNAFAALEAFLKQVAECLVSRGSEVTVQDQEIFKYFIKEFQRVINSNESITRDISIAIRGYGYFAKPCKLFLKDEDIKFMFTTMIQMSEQMYFNDSELKEEKLQNLPSFLEALGFIVEEMDEIPHAFLSFLERLVVVLIEKFPELGKGPQFLCCKAMLKLFLALATKGASLKSFLSQIVYQGLIRTCSHPVFLEEGADVMEGVTEFDVRHISYKDYLELWECFLEGRQYKDQNIMLEVSSLRQDVHRAIYDELVLAILKVANKLDLSSFRGAGSEDDLTSTDESTSAQQPSTPDSPQPPIITSGSITDPITGLQPKAPKDFQIFINLVEFSRKVLLKTKTEWFENWIYTFGKQLVVLSTRFPLVSGFYKMLEIVMKLSRKLIYFKGMTLSDVSSSVGDMDVDQLDFSDCRNCFILFHKFATEVVVRMKQYKDDLMSSCLQLVLSLPNELVLCDIDVIIPALKMAFKLGLGFLPLAEAALDALDTWTAELPSEVLHPYLREVLPQLDGYLKTASELESASEKVAETRLRKSRRSKRKVYKSRENSNTEEENSPLNKVRRRILILLGSLGGRCNLGLLGVGEGSLAGSNGIAWDTKQHLSFAVPFQDMKPNIYLDPFLPRVVELAVSSSDRQTKVASSEVLHSLVLFMLGKSVQIPDAGSKSPLEKLWKRVFPVIVQLACDVEQVCQQLFKPLLFQLIHWFTNNKQYESPDTIILLETLLDGIVHPTDTALRDLSALCLEEFLRWSIKQTLEKQLAKSPINIKSLLKRLYSLATHPSANKRLGAALAFNNIYRVFREEPSLVDMFTLEILVIYLESLAMAHKDDKSLGTQTQCIEVISHLERIIVAKSSVLIKSSKTRRVPRGFSENSATLLHLVPWLVSKCGRPETECRHQCMRLVSVLAPLLPGCSSAQIWMKNTVESDGKDYFISRFEGGFGGKSGIQKYPTLSTINNTFSLTTTKHWFDLVLAALDSYTWSFGERLLTLNSIFQGKTSSVLFKSLLFFIDHLSLNAIEKALEFFQTTSDGVNAYVFSPNEIQEYNRAKCTVLVRLVGFITLLLQIDAKECLKIVPSEFWTGRFFEAIVTCVFEPQSLGFNMADLEVLEKLPEQTFELCKLLACKYLDRLTEALILKISLGGRCNLFEILPLPLSGGEESQMDHSRLQFLVTGYQQLHRAQILLPALDKEGRWNAEKCSEKLLESVFQGVVTENSGRLRVVNLTPTSQELALKLLDLAFDLGLKVESLLQCIMDKTFLTDTKGSSSTIGMVFHHTFHKSIQHFFIKNPSVHLPKILDYNNDESVWVSSTIIGIFESMVKDKTLRKAYGRKVTAVLVTSWDKLVNWWDNSGNEELKRSTVILIRNILLVDPKCLWEVKSSCDMIRTYNALLQDKTITLTVKTQCLELLPCFTVSSFPATQTKDLRSALDTLVSDNFPLSSREFAESNPKCSDYIAALDKILSSLVISGSLMLFDLLISIVCREESHRHEERIQAQLAKFIRRLNLQQAREALDVCFKVFTNDTEYRSLTRRAVIDKVCLVLLRATSTSVIREFYVSHIKKIMNIVEARFTKTSESVFEGQLVSKLCCFELLAVLYARLEKTDLNSMESRITKAYCNEIKTGKELTMAITKSAHATKSENMRGETTLLPLRRQYHCSAYNALISVITCTQTELKFYNGFLFSENLAKGQFLLDNLIDCTKTLHFEMELSAPIDKRTQLTSIRREARARMNTGDSGEYGASLRYLASQYLADSSLSEEVSQFDFSTPIQALSQGESAEQDKITDENTGAPTSPKEIDMDASSRVMEMDELNRHECMASVIGLTNHLIKNKISPQPKQGEAAKEMPPWMSYLQKKLSDHSSQLNVRLFIAKLITNIPEVFEPYAKFWLSPLMELILCPDFMTSELNYFVIDILVTMLSWSAVAVPEDSYSGRHLTNRLLEYLMERCDHPTRSIFKHNLEIIKTFVEVWKERLEVPTKLIYEKFSSADVNKKENSVGIQLMGVVLANKISPFRPGCGVDIERFYQSLVRNLNFKYKDVHAAAAEVIGMTLKHLSEEDDKESCDALSELLCDKLSSMTKELDKFITCVHQLQVHFPPIVDRFINQILFVLPNVHGEFKTRCLEIILSRVKVIPNLFLELRTKGFMNILSHRDEASQVACLKIILGLLSILSVADIQTLMPSVTDFFSNKSIVCRGQMFDILIWIYDAYRFDETFKNEEGSEEVLVTAKDFLLQGLADENKEIRLKLRNFWSDETRLPNSTLERLVQVLRAMYSPNTESQYLSYTTNLLLQLTSQSPDFGRLIFEQPLSECKFQEYQINYSWQQRNSTMTPLFAATQMPSSSSQVSFGSLSVDVTDGGQLRATQNPQFSSTQTASGTGATAQTYDWLNPSSLDTSQSVPASFSVGTQSSSLLFRSNHDRRRFKNFRPKFGLPSSSAAIQSGGSSNENASQSENIMKLKRRFLKDRKGTDVYFAKREIARQKVRTESIEKQKLARENRVVMYRKYREGDLPDIQIKHSDLITPLQALAQCDSNIAKQLFSAIFQGIFSQMDESLTDTQAEETFRDIQNALNNMMTSSLQYFPPFISCIQNLCYNEGKLSLEAGKVTTTSIGSLQQPIGIMLLEKQILQISEDPGERPTKRQKTSASPSPETTATWIELSKLYKSIEDFDVLRGIFSSQIGTQAITREALEAEGRGDYTKALKLYSQATNCEQLSERDPLQVEVDLWDDSILECCKRLTLWDKMEECCLVDVDEKDGVVDLDQMWRDEYFKEHYLPFLLRSKTKQFCSGKQDDLFLNFISNSLKDEQQKAYLENKFSDILALLFILQEDYDRARYYTGTCLQTFLEDWSGLDSMMTSSRSSQLQSLQALTEMQEFLDFISNEGNFSTTLSTTSLLKRWSSREPDPKLHSVDIWDDVMTNRSVYLDKILLKFNKSSQLLNSEDSMEIDGCSINTEQVENIFMKKRVMFSLRLAEVATGQVNFPVAKRQLQNSLHLIRDRLKNDRELEILWTHTYSELNCKKCLILSPSEVIDTAISAIEQLDKVKDIKLLQEDLSTGVRHHLLKSSNLDAITNVLRQNGTWDSLDSSLKEKLRALYSGKQADQLDKVISQVATKSFTTLQLAVKITQSNENNLKTSDSRKKLVTSLMTMANFCDRLLRLKEEDNEQTPKLDMKMLPGIVLRYVLKSMAYESTEARQKFPRLLQLVELYPGSDVEAFKRKSSDVPCWMFISWINQMVALLDKRESQAVHGILQDLAKHYPQALLCPLKISSEQFKFGGSIEEQENKQFVERLNVTLSFPMLDDLIIALEQLTNPDMVFKDWMEEIKVLLASKGNESRIRESYKQMFKKLLDKKGINSDVIDMGSIRRRFAQEFSAEVVKKCGEDGSKIVGMSSTTFSKTMGDIYNKMKASKVVKGGGNLKDYSPWLSTFQIRSETYQLEIPGQYTGRNKPLPEYHVKIAGFDEKVLKLSSLRVPKRVTIHGNDEREYKFLVKGGEDLRLDQRIEQLFSLMNDIMQEDPACHQRNLSLKTYKVIPMTSRIGVIEWLGNTSVLKEFIRNGLSETENKTYHTINDKQDRWISSFPVSKKDSTIMLHYYSMFKKAPRKDVERKFREFQNLIPHDALRRSFVQLASSPEAFLMLRSHFARTYGCMSICHYVLGIGDRHLSNMMVDLEYGGVVGIDFGHAFGSATQFLALPELMPFRLTRQICNLMVPLRESGQLQSTMVYTMRALRNNHEILLNTMDVFVKEPLLDWQNFARKQAEKQKLNLDDMTDQAWYPKEKIKSAKRKLKGDNPAEVMKLDLTLGHEKVEHYKAMLSVLLGDEQFNQRAKPYNGTVENQVACLIDQATDPNLLGRTYHGWEPWV